MHTLFLQFTFAAKLIHQFTTNLWFFYVQSRDYGKRSIKNKTLFVQLYLFIATIMFGWVNSVLDGT